MIFHFKVKLQLSCLLKVRMVLLWQIEAVIVRSVSLWRWPRNRDRSFSGDAFKLISKLPRTRTWELPAEAVDIDDK